jgi:competence protein ComEA
MGRGIESGKIRKKKKEILGMKRTMWTRLSMCVAIVALAVSPAAFGAAKKTPTPAADDATTASSSKSGKVNLNTADEKTIAAVKGVGDKLAQELVKGRPYKTWDDVSKVKGVGSGKKLDSLRKVLKLSEGSGESAKAADKAAPSPTPSKKSSSKGSEATVAPAAAPTAAPAPANAGPGVASAPPAPTKSSSSSSSLSKKSDSSTSAKLAPGTKININTATKEELDALPEIGPVKAQAIVDYRKANGNFAAPEDIMKVPGIKEGTFAKIKDYVVVR